MNPGITDHMADQVRGPSEASVDALPRLALSIRQPWVWAIINGGKDIENRQWSTRIRGPICIHASAGMARGEYEDCLSTIHHISRSHPFQSNLNLPAFGELQRGGIIGTASITDCVSQSISPWFFGRFGFVLSDAKPIDQVIPLKGALGFFDWRQRLPEGSLK